uniref:NR LBD domain-containing protein n=1 Tax=Macrostomum lignano TaxID=282301 RepID=A0A1I8FHQ9_9PLAT
NVVCSVMLSQRVILVLSGHWPELEDALQHACPPAGQRKAQNRPVTLGDALELPDLIKSLTVLSANHRNFFDRLLLTLKHENIVLSDSSTTLCVGDVALHRLRRTAATCWCWPGAASPASGVPRPEFRHSLSTPGHQPSVDLRRLL